MVIVIVQAVPANRHSKCANSNQSHEANVCACPVRVPIFVYAARCGWPLNRRVHACLLACLLARNTFGEWFSDTRRNSERFCCYCCCCTSQANNVLVRFDSQLANAIHVVMAMTVGRKIAFVALVACVCGEMTPTVSSEYCSATPPPSTPAKPNAPNFLLILTDDLDEALGSVNHALPKTVGHFRANGSTADNWFVRACVRACVRARGASFP